MKKLGLIDKTFLLKRTPLFESLDLDLLLAFADKLTTVIFKNEEQIFPVDQEAHRMFFIVKGNVILKDANDTPIIELSSPQFFGDESLFNELPRHYAAYAGKNTVLLALSKPYLNMMISEAPIIGQRLLQMYTKALPLKNRYTQGEIS